MMSQGLAHIAISGSAIGIAGLKTILQEVASLGIDGEERLKTELLRRVKARNYVPASVETGYAEALLREYRRFIGQEVVEESRSLTIRILGPGCPRCEPLAIEAMSALAELQLAADVEHVKDPMTIAKYGLLVTPALLVNGRVRSFGRVPSKERIKRWLEEFC